MEDVMSMYEKMTNGHKEGEMDEEGGIIVTPKPGFVVKTTEKSGQKVFLNMVTHKLVDPPENKPLPDSEENGIRVPLSLGDPREDFDKKGGICRVFDVIWNPETLKSAQEDNVFRQLLVELSFAQINQKHKVELSLDYKVIKLRYKGKSISQQRIRGKKGPKIQEMGSVLNENYKEEEAKVKEIASSANHIERIPEWDLFVQRRSNQEIEYYDGINGNPSAASKLIFHIKLPLLMTKRGINLEGSEELLQLHVKKLYQLRLWFPCTIDPTTIDPVWDFKDRILRVSIETVLPATITETEEEQEEGTGSVTDSSTLNKDFQFTNNMLFDVV
eukprot:CAMPEP_0115016558 /NCGR_PEP_ID=MMETSP0216-20121206/27519_1 /TAXON_ID=223996 /ORGANISM="Protocruzia adherens, Strain Boccale" /LENGTH=329 /DNA_ID=CAMNT_0002387059 /DNA_START=100 /DNA_END=1089 /DNA_ORIENTATION=-